MDQAGFVSGPAVPREKQLPTPMAAATSGSARPMGCCDFFRFTARAARLAATSGDSDSPGSRRRQASMSASVAMGLAATVGCSNCGGKAGKGGDGSIDRSR